MKLGTYGLGTSVRGPASIGGGGLAGAAMGQQQDAMGVLGNVAQEEQRRNMENARLAREAKAGNAALGSSLGSIGGAALGAKYGFIGGPMGAAIGGVVGALLGGLF